MSNKDTKKDITITVKDFQAVFYKMVVILAQQNKITASEFASALSACECTIRAIKSADKAGDLEDVIRISKECNHVKVLMRGSVEPTEKNSEQEDIDDIKEKIDSIIEILKKYS